MIDQKKSWRREHARAFVSHNKPMHVSATGITSDEHLALLSSVRLFGMARAWRTLSIYTHRQLNAAIHRITITQAGRQAGARKLLDRRRYGGKSKTVSIRIFKFPGSQTSSSGKRCKPAGRAGELAIIGAQMNLGPSGRAPPSVAHVRSPR